ncbi:MAG: C39 family peptidase [Euryarchaeota archaeon]|nr:C39 family peptidase [Euryarchaeota archaeon]
MQTTNYTCGPAALATVLNNIGINATEQELVTLAGTDENGTTMYGLAEAAKAKGLNAVGMKLSVDDLKKNNIVFITIDGGSHYSVVREVTVGSVKLADPSLGNIEMSREKFAEVYSGNALVIIDPNAPSQEVSNSTQATGTAEQTSNGADTNSTSVQADNSKILTNEEMQSINGKYWQFLAFVAIGTIIISVRNKYVPKKYWCYCAYHPPFKKVRSYIGKDHKIHYIEYDA